MIKIKACAKINLTLEITGVRDDGYHLINSVMQSVDLYDNIKIEKDNILTVFSTDNTLGDKNDICYKAAVFFFEKAGVDGGAKITVTKNIPLSAGLGGGSADAAAVILGLNKLYNEPLKLSDMLEIALNLGADVPYFFYGGAVYARGIGEICEKINDMPECFIVLAKREQKKSTKYMYSVIDDCKKPISINTNKMLSAIKDGDLFEIAKNTGNAFSVAWDDKTTVDILNSIKPLCVTLSGSGPTHFAIFNDIKSANECLKQLKSANIDSFITKPTNKAIIFE